jgi:hypothetical protein
MQRLAFKILRYTNYCDVHAERHKVEGRVGDKTDMLCCILRGLEGCTRHFALHDDPAGLGKNAREWPDGVGLRNPSSQDRALDVKELAPFHEAIEGVLLTYGMNIIVLKGGLDASLMKGCVDTVSRVFGNQCITPVIASSSVFKYMLRFYNPFLYTNFAGSRKVAYGKDLLPDIQPPDMRFFVNKVLEQTATVLTFSQSHALISPPNPDWYSGRAFESIVDRSLFIKLYLEKGVIKPWHNELLAEARKHYPDHYKKLDELKEEAGYFKYGTLNRKAFGLLKGIANDIHKSVSTSSVVDNLLK